MAYIGFKGTTLLRLSVDSCPLDFCWTAGGSRAGHLPIPVRRPFRDNQDLGTLGFRHFQSNSIHDVTLHPLLNEPRRRQQGRLGDACYLD